MSFTVASKQLIIMAKYPHYTQFDVMDSGAVCLRMVCKYFGKNYPLETLRELSFITKEGTSLMNLSDAGENLGFRTMKMHLTFQQLVGEVELPCIIQWSQYNYVVIYKITKDRITIGDPVCTEGIVTISKKDFLQRWIPKSDMVYNIGAVLTLRPTADFYASKDEEIDKSGFKFLVPYLLEHKRFLLQVLFGLLFGSMLQLIFPFLTQAVVDIGINTRNLNFIYLVLIAQLVLFISQMSVDFIRSWILLHISTRMNITLISDFLIKLMKLPISFFERKNMGDLLQRVNDHKRIEKFLTTQVPDMLFSIVNIIIFGLVLIIYYPPVFFVFLIGSSLYIGWVTIFLKKRRILDYQRFTYDSANRNKFYEIITGMQEIKLNNAEKLKRWTWERLQAGLFKVNVKELSIKQRQQSGSVFFNETKNIIITIMAATAVIKGDITLGMMLSIQYILGQLNSPLLKIIDFLHARQDAKISLERLGEIHNKDNEESLEDRKITMLPKNPSLTIKNLVFHYDGPNSPRVIDNVNLEIQANSVTAIVGASGSGKTTILKLILGFFSPTKGCINVGNVALENYSNSWWRSKCGVVMQDGYMFSDTLANNVAVGVEYVDKQRLIRAVEIANIRDFIENLPHGYNTQIGWRGMGLSQGQKQRILIARAVYKQPEFFFFDEGTNALDANNERVIMDNLNRFFRGRTVVVVAHRLSTVKNADNIIVMDKGDIIEQGTHQELTNNRGAYYNLVKNQLEMGS